MPYKISGTLGDDARIIVVNESDWSAETNSNESAGAYEIGDLDSGTKLVIARKYDGEILSYTGVTGEYYADVDEYTKLLVHSDHSDGSTTFTDSSLYEHTITRHGSVEHDTAQKKFCNSSIYIPDTGYLTCADSNDWYLGDTYTLETWLRTSSVPGGLKKIFYHYSDANAFFGLFFRDSQLRWYVKKAPAEYVALDYNQANLFQNDQWYHIAVTCNSRVARLYINGVYKVKHAAMTDCQNYSSDLQILPDADQSAWLDEIRISKGIARWTTETSFSVPTAPYWYTCS